VQDGAAELQVAVAFRRRERPETRFARWHIFKSKIPIWVNLGGSCIRRCWYTYLMAIWYILWLFGLFFPFWYIVLRKIWQPCLRPFFTILVRPYFILPGDYIQLSRTLLDYVNGSR
jgi:hypothetical protein